MKYVTNFLYYSLSKNFLMDSDVPSQRLKVGEVYNLDKKKKKPPTRIKISEWKSNQTSWYKHH